MLPRSYRVRYALIIGLSLLLHAIIIGVILFQHVDKEETKKERHQVNIKLDKPAKREEQQKKKESEDKKKKADSENKDKAELEKAKAEKAKAEKAKAEKAKAEKAKAEKAKAEKAKAEKAKAEKAKAEKAKAENEKELGGSSKKQNDRKQTSNIKSIDPRKRLVDAIPGSATKLDKRTVAKSFVQTQLSQELFSRNIYLANQVKKAMSRQEYSIAVDFFEKSYRLIAKNLEAPKKSYRDVGKKYSGQINFLIDREGYIYNVVFKQRSGSKALDSAFINALIETKRIPLPSGNKKIRDYVNLKPFLLYYDESDLIQN